jgi:threonine aldolase
LEAAAAPSARKRPSGCPLARWLTISPSAAGRQPPPRCVQAESHLFNDCGDCAQTLSGLHLVPLAPGRASFSLEDVERAAYDASMGRVETPIGAIQIETPVRRRRGERFDFAEMKKVAAWAHAHNVGLHLDGARLFLESAYAARPVKEYAALFDTVYISMYKYFNAASGAVLAGPKAQLAGLYHTRRMFGGGMRQSWPFAAVALHQWFEQRFRTAMESAERDRGIVQGFEPASSVFPTARTSSVCAYSASTRRSTRIDSRTPASAPVTPPATGSTFRPRPDACRRRDRRPLPPG